MSGRRLLGLAAGIALLGCGGEPDVAPAGDPELAEAAASPAPAAVPPAWSEPPPPIRDAPVVDPERLHRAELPNGLRLIVMEDHRLPRVSLGLSVQRGAAMEGTAEAGIADFTAEVMRRGAGERGALELAETVDAIGATLAVGAGWDELTIGVAGLSRDLDLLVEVLADVALRPRFDAAEASKARSETLAALEKARDDPETLESWNIARATYGEHRFGLPLAGTPESVARLDAAAARAFYTRTFLPNAAVLSAAGDVDAAAFLEQIRAAFGSWERGEVPDAGPAPPAESPPARRVVVVDRPDLSQARIALAHEGIARTDPERIAISMMNTVVGGGGFSSRLMTVVRSDAGLTYGVSSGFSLRREPGPFIVSTFTRVPETRRVIDLLLAELARARDEPPDAEELRNAKMLAAGRFALGLETSSAVVASLVDLELHGLPPDSLDTYRRRVAAVSVEQSAAAAREHLHPDRAAIVVVGPAEALVPQLEGLGSVEVVAP